MVDIVRTVALVVLCLLSVLVIALFCGAVLWFIAMGLIF